MKTIAILSACLIGISWVNPPYSGYEPDSGTARVFTRTSTFWTEQAYLRASNTEQNDAFGCAVTASGDSVGVGA